MRNLIPTTAAALTAMTALLLNVAGCPQGDTQNESLSGTATDVTSSANAPDAGAGSAAESELAVNASSPATPVLLVADGVSGVLAFAKPAAADGDITPTNHISGTYGYNAWLVSPVAVGVDAPGDLVALTSNDGISVFNDAASATGNLYPDRDIYGPATQLSLDAATNTGMAIDRANDRVFVCNYKGVMVFDSFSDSGLKGDVVPTRMITSPDVREPHGLALGANGDLYLADVDKVAVFASGGTRNGSTRADRIIQIPASYSVVAGTLIHPAAVFVDRQDQLYVVQSDPGFIFVLDDASHRAGTVTPDRVVDFDFDPSSSSVFSKDFHPNALVVDSQGVGYVSDLFHKAIRIVPSIGTRSGTLVPERTIQGGNTRIKQAMGLYIWE